ATARARSLDLRPRAAPGAASSSARGAESFHVPAPRETTPWPELLDPRFDLASARARSSTSVARSFERGQHHRTSVYGDVVGRRTRNRRSTRPNEFTANRNA